MLEKPFYTKLKETAEKLGTTSDMLISNALLLTLKKLERKERKQKLWESSFEETPKGGVLILLLILKF